MKNLLVLILFLGMYLLLYNPLYGQVDTIQLREWEKNIEDTLKSIGIHTTDSFVWCDNDTCFSDNLLIQKEMVDYHKSVYELDVLFLRISTHGARGDFLIRLTIQSSVLEIKVIKGSNTYITKDDSSLMVVIGNLLENIVRGNFMKVGNNYHNDSQVYMIKKDGVKEFSFNVVNDMMGSFDDESKEALGSNYRIFELLMGFYDKALGR